MNAAEKMNPFRSNWCNPTMVVILLLFFPCQLRGAPTVSLSVDEEHIAANTTFFSTLTLSWQGDADQYLVEPPQLLLPESIEEISTASSSTTSGDRYFLEYRFALRAQEEGDFVLKPIEISYWEKGTTKAETVKTEALNVRVTSFSTTFYEKYWQPGLLAIILVSLFTTLYVLSTKKKRKRGDHGKDTPPLKETIIRELDECATCKITGDWENYLRKAIAIRDKLPSENKGGKALAALDTLAEGIHYGGLRPTTEEINRIQRQLEQACKSAFPNDTDKGCEYP